MEGHEKTKIDFVVSVFDSKNSTLGVEIAVRDSILDGAKSIHIINQRMVVDLGTHNHKQLQETAMVMLNTAFTIMNHVRYNDLEHQIHMLIRELQKRIDKKDERTKHSHTIE